MKSGLLSFVPALLAGGAAASGCAADNCLRALRATQTPGRLEAALSFCATYTAAAAAAEAAEAGVTVALSAVPTYAVAACTSNQVGPLSVRLVSACSCIAPLVTTTPSLPSSSSSSSSSIAANNTSTGTPTSVSSTPPSVATEPCALASSAWAAQVALSVATPTIAAALAYDCLRSVPLHTPEALALVDAIEPYLEWQTDPVYKAHPPPDYFYPGYDLFGALARVRANLQRGGVYDGEHAFQTDLYQQVFGRGHDGHFVFFPDLLTTVFDYGRPLALVSVSDNGVHTLPVIKVYGDVLLPAGTATSPVVRINGEDAVAYVEQTVLADSGNQDPDAAYNSMFYSVPASLTGSSGNFFAGGGGRGRFTYPGPNTTLTFANGTERTVPNFAYVRSPLAGIADGETMYRVFCNSTTPEEATRPPPPPPPPPANGIPRLPGYPAPVVLTSDGVVSCYFLDGAGFEDVVVIAVLAFESASPAEFQAVTHACFTQAVAAGRTKLVVDLSGNGGGYVFQGYDFFRQLFPQTLQDGFSRWKINPAFAAMARIVSDAVAGVDPRTSGNAQLVGLYETWFNYRYDLDVANHPFPSFRRKFGPYVYAATEYTAVMRWNLADPLLTTNTTFGFGIEISGYGSLANLTQPFRPHDIVLLYDGFCASTCSVASEMLRLQGGVRSVALGGRPQRGPIQGVGGVKGAQNVMFADVYAIASEGVALAETDAQRAALARYTTTPLQRSPGSSLNVRDQLLRGVDLVTGLPAQYVREEADCRLYWTAHSADRVPATDGGHQPGGGGRKAMGRSTESASGPRQERRRSQAYLGGPRSGAVQCSVQS
ncbi:peptidase s41 family protein [Niveomyces insectorum RCEF 264]|uniref:Peptidase s41 family protein n=1 Tax=Niveomyces insectorum RCEF 264 TaxID=1081102 RepID=A0A167ZUS4_9HYPO|nr:peptidase s41 family protein [Niveomyces insectorum RCEF 264]